jgi:hypothetical protein
MLPGRFRLLVLIVAVLVALLAPGCERAPADQVERPAAIDEPKQPPGHLRMVELLERVAVDTAQGENPFMGLGKVPGLRAELAALPDTPDPRRWLFHKLLGKHELRLGDADKAIEHYTEAYRQTSLFRDEMPREDALKTMFELGVAYMRWGELRNCAQRHTVDTCIFPIRGGGVHVERQGSETAIRHFMEILEQTAPNIPVHVRSKWLLNVAHMTLGTYPDGVPTAYRIDPEAFVSDEEVPRFFDVAPRLGLNSFDVAGGAAVDDFDGDALLDIMISTSDPAGQLRFFHSNGDGTFTERTREAGLAGIVGGLNIIHADYDNDGHNDLLVLRGAWWRQHGRHPNSLLHNNGNGTFTDVTFETGLGEPYCPTQTASWADFDNDGDLDLYVGCEFDPNVEAPGQLFRNNGDGTFSDITEQAGVRNDRFAKAVVWGDYDGNRLPDLYVSNLSARNRLYRNNGDGTFLDVAPELDVTRPIASFSTWFWDFDNNGALDLFVSGYGGGRSIPPDVADVAANYLGLTRRAELACLFRGDGRGGFVDVATEHNLVNVTLPMGANFGDLDNNGFLDFYLGTGYPYYEGLMPNVMYLNRDGTAFADVTTSGGFGHLQKGHGIAFADLDNDGDQDVYAQMGGMYPGDAFGNALFENPGFGNHWIKVKLVGVRSNRSAIGARIRIDVVEAGERRSIYRHVNSGGSFGANPLRQEIGLGRADEIERVEVYWPTSDETQTFHDVQADRLIEITEGGQTYRELPLPAMSFGS